MLLAAEAMAKRWHLPMTIDAPRVTARRLGRRLLAHAEEASVAATEQARATAMVAHAAVKRAQRMARQDASPQWRREAKRAQQMARQEASPRWRREVKRARQMARQEAPPQWRR